MYFMVQDDSSSEIASQRYSFVKYTVHVNRHKGTRCKVVNECK